MIKKKGGKNKAEEIKKLGANLTVSFTADAATDKSGQNIKPENNKKVYDYFIAPELDPKEKDDYVDNKDWKVEVNGDEATITISFDTKIANLGKAYADDFKFMADNTGNELKVKDDVVVVGNTLKYTFEDISKLENTKSITVKADKDNIDVRTDKDEANNDQKYKPTNDDINGWKLQIGEDAKKAMAEREAEKVAVKAINEATAENIGKVIEDNATKLGLELTEYNALTNKTPVHNELVGKSFADKAAIKTAFDKAVGDQKQAEDNVAAEAAANKAISEAKDLLGDKTLEASDDNLITVLNAIPGMADKGVTLAVKAEVTSNDAKIETNGAVTKGTAQEEMNVTITISKDKGALQEKAIKVTVPAK